VGKKNNKLGQKAKNTTNTTKPTPTLLTATSTKPPVNNAF
jgi:hypothetical protein